MKTTSEIRKEARQIMRGGWFWRLAFAGVIFMLILNGVGAHILMVGSFFVLGHSPVPRILLALSTALCTGIFIWLLVWWFVARTVFYREVQNNH